MRRDDVGEFKEASWAWKSKDSDVRVGYMGMSGRVSVADLIEHLRKITPDVLISDILLNYATVKWERPATPEELAERAARYAESDRKREEWERTALARLLEKYGLPEPSSD